MLKLPWRDLSQAFIHCDIKMDHRADLAERIAEMRIDARRAFQRKRFVLFRGQWSSPANQLLYERRLGDRFFPAICFDLRAQMRAVTPPFPKISQSITHIFPLLETQSLCRQPAKMVVIL